MAEKLKEFTNVTLTGTDFTDNEYTIFTNNGKTKAVVKDVNAVPVSPLKEANIVVTNGVADVASGGKSTGFELVTENNSLKLKLDPVMSGGMSQTYDVSWLPNNVSSKADSLITNRDNTYPLKASSTYAPKTDTSSSASVVSSMSSPAWFHINKQGTRAYYFYYDGNSTTQFNYASRNTGTGVLSGWNNWESGSYHYAALDADADKVYIHINSSSVRVYDLSDLTYTDNSSAWNGAGNFNPSSYARSTAVNGIFFSQPSNAYTTSIKYYDTINNVSATLTGDFYSTSSGLIAATYNPTEKRYYIVTRSSSNTKMSYIDAANLSGNCTATGAGQGVMDIYNEVRYMGGTTTGLFSWPDSNSVIRFGKAEKGAITLLSPSITGPAYSYSGVTIRAGTSTATPIEELDVGLKLKVSGVEITGA